MVEVDLSDVVGVRRKKGGADVVAVVVAVGIAVAVVLAVAVVVVFAVAVAALVVGADRGVKRRYFMTLVAMMNSQSWSRSRGGAR